jgi:hypothetical protein
LADFLVYILVMKNAIFWDVTTRVSCKNGHFGERVASIIRVIETVLSSETSFLTRATRRHIPDDGILHSHHSENLKSHIALTGWAL